MNHPWRVRAGSARHRSDSGAAAVEFAIVFAGIFVPLMMGLLQYGWYFYTAQVTGSAARETARRLSVGDCQGTDTTTGMAKAQKYARQHASLSSLAVTYGSTTSQNNVLPGAGQVVRVEAELDAVLFEFVPMPNDGLIYRMIEARVEDTTEDSPC